MVAMDSTHSSCTALDFFLPFSVRTRASSRNRQPYPASPMIMAKKRAKKPRNQKEISYSIFPAVVAVPSEVVDRLDELLADTTGEPTTDNKQAEPQPTTGKVEQVIWDEQSTSSLSEAGISGADTNDKVKPEPDANPEGSNSKKVKQKKSKAKTK